MCLCCVVGSERLFSYILIIYLMAVNMEVKSVDLRHNVFGISMQFTTRTCENVHPISSHYLQTEVEAKSVSETQPLTTPLSSIFNNI